MTKWTAETFKATYKANGYELKLQVKVTWRGMPDETWYWWVWNEENKTVDSGSCKGDSFRGKGQAKAACTRAAKAYAKGTRT